MEQERPAADLQRGSRRITRRDIAVLVVCIAGGIAVGECRRIPLPKKQTSQRQKLVLSTLPEPLRRVGPPLPVPNNIQPMLPKP